MQTTAHQQRILRKMLELIASYEQSGIILSQLVDELEAAVNAGEFREQDFVRQWYELWAPLEITRAVKHSDATEMDVKNDLKVLRAFLLTYVSTERLG
jgi:hypothetical protein